ncbi:MAG: YebC/PmpR family DNA-binding transcriptional regulator [Prolixibacteraceae bacterium]|jgi:YebC/PmpR family DNA-binding regulatory protein|nr:YebC/PmpR family DNA-binding transcriptional regulator [Prolixibacteraceae bacterium]MDD4755880.1 YebC/PmpR family DNA-binding transcriptional regulator [Prolixibacteraceae bacterium]NLO03903.1 YebC/PmpR family DNA-binding transcriptional regulator [Bacteroidales bacterium]
MSGHSKWSTIKRKKGAADSKRSKIFSKLSKEITVAAKIGGPDIDANSRLRLAVQNAKGQNMSKDVIDRAISKADKDTSNFAEMTFEGYGPGGIAVFVECLSDNNNRTVGSVRSIFSKNNGHLGTNGSVAYLFDTKGIFVIPANKIPDREMFELEIIDAGAEEIEENDNFFEITSALEDFGSVSSKLEELGIEAESQGLQRIPATSVTLDVEEAKKVLRLVERLEEDDDVQNVFHNLEITPELELALAEE